MDLSIIIVNWNTRDLLAQCIRSVLDDARTCQHLSVETFVVDNASSDGSTHMVRERFPQVRLIENCENVGFARANNQAIRASRSKYVLLLNSDTIVQPDLLRRMVMFMDTHSEAGITGGKLLWPDGSFQASFGDFPTVCSELLNATGMAKWFYGRYYPSHSPSESLKSRTVGWIGGACLMARREAIQQVGLLDESYFMYSEEMDWCYRFWKNSWKVFFLPDAQVIHLGGQSSNLFEEKKIIWLFQSRMLFFSKYRNPTCAWLLRGTLRVIAAGKAVYWFCIGLTFREHKIAWRKLRSNWQIVTSIRW